MKKYLLVCSIIISTLLLVSWSFVDHQNVVLIEENDLAAQASQDTFVLPAKAYAVIVPAQDVAQFTGKTVRVQCKVYGYKHSGSSILVNLGAAYPNQKLTVVLRGEAKKIAANLDGKNITILGKVIDYKGKPEIEIRDASDIIVQ